ncbi:hypothetical protein ACIGMX_34680 [Streptomyces aquilus]|uniref:hypothetical protein n=1 Tax=Streptomyces aquilus TaxID=2548456 RepID=UPI0037CEC201
MVEQPSKPDLRPRESPIALAPATVEACATDLRTPQEQVQAMAEAGAQRGCIGQGGTC